MMKAGVVCAASGGSLRQPPTANHWDGLASNCFLWKAMRLYEWTRPRIDWIDSQSAGRRLVLASVP